MDEKYFEQSSFRENPDQYDGNELAIIEKKEESPGYGKLSAFRGIFMV